MDVDEDIIGVGKFNTKVFCKEKFEKLTKYWLGASYLVFKIKSVVPGERLIISICQKYYVRKVIYFFAK